CVKNVPGDNCAPGKDASQADKDAIKAALESDPQVEKVYYESKKDAFEEYQRVYKDSPVKEILTVDTIQDSFRVKLVNPENYREVVAATQTMKGVQAVVDLHTALDPLFVWLNSLRWTTVGLSALLLVAAALQITNTIRMAVFARRRELEIMKLVGASNRFILTPFLLESLVAGLIGAILAAGTLAAGTYVIVMKKFAVTMSTIAWVNWHHVWVAIGWLAVVAVVLSLIPSYV
ncbi:permease-like cell division protein FtsX, partial [Bacillus cereus]|nr:permease-like cell division protein FtsX [Bacillus cereus]